MLGFVKGILALKNNNTIIIDCNGVGYEMIVSSHCFERIGQVGEEARVFTHLQVRQDELTLIGFEDLQEREVFRKLLLVNGVGPKLAITILSGISATDLSVAIATEQADALKRIKGVGSKIRERIMLELREKMNYSGDPVPVAGVGGSIYDNALAVLMDWGVQRSAAQQILQNNLTAEDTLETIIAKAFQEMGR